MLYTERSENEDSIHSLASEMCYEDDGDDLFPVKKPFMRPTLEKLNSMIYNHL